MTHSVISEPMHADPRLRPLEVSTSITDRQEPVIVRVQTQGTGQLSIYLNGEVVFTGAVENY